MTGPSARGCPDGLQGGLGGVNLNPNPNADAETIFGDEKVHKIPDIVLIFP